MCLAGYDVYSVDDRFAFGLWHPECGRVPPTPLHVCVCVSWCSQSAFENKRKAPDQYVGALLCVNSPDELPVCRYESTPYSDITAGHSCAATRQPFACSCACFIRSLAVFSWFHSGCTCSVFVIGVPPHTPAWWWPFNILARRASSLTANSLFGVCLRLLAKSTKPHHLCYSSILRPTPVTHH